MIQLLKNSKILKKDGRLKRMKDTITMTETKTPGHSNIIAVKKEWITTKIVNMIEERIRKYKSLNSIDGQESSRVLRNLIIKKLREAKEKYLEEMCSKIEILIKT